MQELRVGQRQCTLRIISQLSSDGGVSDRFRVVRLESVGFFQQVAGAINFLVGQRTGGQVRDDAELELLLGSLSASALQAPQVPLRADIGRGLD